MNEFDPELLENELERLKPVLPPEQLMARLLDLKVQTTYQPDRHSWARRFFKLQFLRWFAPMTAAATVAGIVYVHQLKKNSSTVSTPILTQPITPGTAAHFVEADKVEIVQQLVATFDAVARLPNGEPVRFRCSEWLDDVVLQDSGQKILIKHQLPRLEVKQVGFETY